MDGILKSGVDGILKSGGGWYIKEWWWMVY